MESKELIKYIERVYQLESSLYNQRKIMNGIKGGIRKYENARYEKEKSFTSGTSDYYIMNGMKTIAVCTVMLGVFIWFILALFGVVDFSFGTLGAIVVIIGLIIVIPFFLSVSSKEKEIERENDRIKKYNEELRERNQILVEHNAEKINSLHQELKRRQEIYNQTIDILEEYYSKNIIYIKYRNLVSISSFYEYLCSGRCERLEGHEGAYNIFESEIRADRIIEKLDVVISRLDSIQANQRMLYIALSEGNRKADNLIKQMAQTVNSLQKLEDNTSLIAYNSEITAQNTAFLKWIEFYRN